MPATAPDMLSALPYNPESLQEYQQPKADFKTCESAKHVSEWDRFRVVHHVSDYILRVALHAAVFEISDESERHAFDGGPVTDSILAALCLCLEISAEEGMHDAKWLIVCAYLWTSWQRSLMIHFWTSMASQLDGFEYGSASLYRKGVSIVPDILRWGQKQNIERLRRIPYLCGWAFRSLHNDRANIAMDLRYFHRLYHHHFGKRPPICNPGPEQCDGSSSHDCKRFKNTETRNQSMHDYRCRKRCPKLFWDRESFVSVPEAKAVDIAKTDSKNLHYTLVKKDTLTVSHVWSHGQGGRPDNVGLEGTGFNLCLHSRYTALAKSLGCGSYWMDTPCIPNEKELRWECIAQIPSIFATSSKTVICDRDIMDIDVSNPTIDAYESVLATLLVCDWGIRAWTLLEAMRARSGLFVLCRHNRLLDLQEVLRAVHSSGRMDLSNLYLTRDYLQPPMAIADFELFPGKIITSNIEREIQEGFVDIGTAAALLSHRHATRDGDDLIIWSLLIGDMETSSPVAMWQRQVGKHIRTGCLISSAKRIQGHQGLSWAPFSPTTRQRSDNEGTVSRVYPAYAGQETSGGLVTTEGLRAKWLTFEFLNPKRAIQDKRVTQGSTVSKQCIEIATRYLGRYKWGLLLQAMPTRGPRSVPVAYSDSIGQLIVVCGSMNKAVWEWRGVYEWDPDIALPEFRIAEILIA